MSGGHTWSGLELLYDKRHLRKAVFRIRARQFSTQTNIHIMLFHRHSHFCRLHSGSHASVVCHTEGNAWDCLQRSNCRRKHYLRGHNAEQQAWRGTWILWADKQHSHGSWPDGRSVYAWSRGLYCHILCRNGRKHHRACMCIVCQGEDTGVYEEKGCIRKCGHGGKCRLYEKTGSVARPVHTDERYSGQYFPADAFHTLWSDDKLCGHVCQ